MNKKIDGDIAPQANLEHLKNQAKNLLKKFKEGSPHAIGRFARANVTKKSTSKDSSSLSLSNAQLVIARENGHSTWAEMKHAMETGAFNSITSDYRLSIQAIDQIWLDCVDLSETERFYSDLLGLRKTGQVPGQMLFFDCDGINLLLGVRDTARPNSILYFRAGSTEDDMQNAYNHLKSAGVSMGDSPHCIARNWEGFDVWVAFFSDPSGNQLAFKCDVPVSYNHV